MTCLHNNPVMCENKSASCCGTLPFDNHFEIHLQNGSVLCICSRASCLSAAKGFSVISGLVSTVVKSGVAGFVMEGAFEGLCPWLFNVVKFAFLCLMLVHPNWWL